MIAAVMLLLCGCHQAQQPQADFCGHEAYSDLIARLEAKDYEAARSIIDILEGRELAAETASPETQLPVQAETVQTPAVPDSVITADMEIVELTEYTVRDYFTFEEQFFISDKSGCMQYITLKEEYRDRLIAVEEAKVEVNYLLCEAHGKINLKAETFRSEYFDVTSRERVSKTLELDSNGMGWISQMLYFSRRGYFPDFAMDVEIRSGSGKLILAAE